MFPLTSQLRLIAFQAQEPLYRLRGQPVPKRCCKSARKPATAARRPAPSPPPRARLAEAVAALAAVGSSEFDGAAEAPLAHDLPMGMVFDMTGETFSVRDWALPQLAFHHVTAYAILRQAGVPLGKVDYVPHMFAYLRPGTMPAA